MNEQRTPLAKLVWLDPFTSKTREHPICEGDKLTIGRSAMNDIQIAEGHISRQHAVVACQEGAFTIDDVGSANGTFVNGVQVYGENELAIGDEVHLFVSVLKLLSTSDRAPRDAVDRVSAVAGDRASLRITRGPQQDKSSRCSRKKCTSDARRRIPLGRSPCKTRPFRGLTPSW